MRALLTHIPSHIYGVWFFLLLGTDLVPGATNSTSSNSGVRKCLTAPVSRLVGRSTKREFPWGEGGQTFCCWWTNYLFDDPPKESFRGERGGKHFRVGGQICIVYTSPPDVEGNRVRGNLLLFAASLAERRFFFIMRATSCRTCA